MEFSDDLDDQKAEDLEMQPLTAGDDTSQAVDREKSSSSRDDSLREIVPRESNAMQPTKPTAKDAPARPTPPERDTRSDQYRMRGIAISSCLSMAVIIIGLLMDSLYIVEYKYPLLPTFASGKISWRLSDFTLSESAPSKLNAEVAMSYESLYNAPEPRFDPKFQINAGRFLSISLILACVTLFMIIVSVIVVECRGKSDVEEDPERNEINVDWCTTFTIILMCMFVIFVVGGFVLYSVFEDADSEKGPLYLRNSARELNSYHFPAINVDQIEITSGRMGLTQILGIGGFGIALVFSCLSVMCAHRCPKKCRRWRCR